MISERRVATLALLVLVFALIWTAAGCAAVVPGGRPEGMPARHVFPVQGGDALDVPVSYPAAGIAWNTRRMPLERVQFDTSGRILFVEYLSGNRGCHRLVSVEARTEEGRLEVAVVEGDPVSLTTSCSAELVFMLTAVGLPEPVDPLDPPPVHDGVSSGTVALASAP